MRDVYVRLDLTIKEAVRGDTEGLLHVAMELDPRRYRIEKRDGKTVWIDKFFGYAIDEDTLKSAMPLMANTPVYELSPNIERTDEYVGERIAAIESEHSTGAYTPPKKKPRQHAKLSTASTPREISFLSLDVAGSTILQASYGEAYSSAFNRLVREVGTLIGQFNARILKLTGDGLIAYIEHPSVNRQCDNLVDLGLSVLFLANRLNAVKVEGEPDILIRVGADHGPAIVKTFIVPATGFSQEDVVSDALNRAVKIQEAAPVGSLLIGYALYERLHVNWLERAQKFDLALTLHSELQEYPTYKII